MPPATDTAAEPAETIKLTYRLLSELQGAERNPKNHDLPAIRASFERFGIAGPVAVLDERTDRMVAGHGRVTVLSEMEAAGDKPPRRVKVTRKGWTVPVILGVSFKSDEEAEAYLIADNAIPMLGGWDNDALLDTLAELPMLEGTGYDDDSLRELLQSAGRLADQEGAFLDDLAGPVGTQPATPGASVTSPGDAGIVELRLPMSIEDRDEAIRALRAHKNRLGLESLSAALLALVASPPPTAEAQGPAEPAAL